VMNAFKKSCALGFAWAAAFLCCLSVDAIAAPRGARTIFGVGRGLTFYTSTELADINARLGNSPRLTVNNEFGRSLTLQASVEQSLNKDVWIWGAELQHWSETHRGIATSGDASPRSEATLAFARLWFTGGVRLWPWVGPMIVKQNTNFTGLAVRMARVRPLGSGLFSWLRLSTGPLLWKHNYLLSDEVNQTQIDYASRTLSWEGGVRWSLGWRLGSFCDVGVDLSSSLSVPVKGESLVGQFYLSGRNARDSAESLSVENISRSRWRSMQALMFVRFFYP
jgi:hypothetical protein